MQNVPGADLYVANNRPSIRKDDKDSEGLFALEGEHAVITEEMERLLGQKYSNIRYTVNVRIADASGNDDTQPYYVSRELFKHILVDRPVRFEASGEPISTIDKLLEPEG